jgi:excinuclease ABC subunit A
MPEKLVVLSPTTEKKNLRDSIQIQGARANNLKNIDLIIPKNKLVVVTGVSGSGKSSITLDTLYAEGQRRYVESLSAYARQFMGRMKKPEVDFIRGICPAIAIEQKVGTSNARSTVGTMTEIYDFLRLIFARVGKTISPISGEVVKRHQVSDVVDYLLNAPDGSKAFLYIPLQQKYGARTLNQELSLLLQKGYTRVYWNGELRNIQDVLEITPEGLMLDKPVADCRGEDIRILIDRFSIRQDDPENNKRIADSVQTAFYESEGQALVELEGMAVQAFNNRFEADGMEFLDPTPTLFNYNNPFGACPTCEGFGRIMGIDESKVIPDPDKSVFEGAVACWRGEKHGEWLNYFLNEAHHHNFPVHRPYNELSAEERKMLWKGKGRMPGINTFFTELEEKMYKIQNRVLLARYRGRTICNTCDGGRLREEATYVRVGGKNIPELVETPSDELYEFFQSLQLNDFDQQVASRLLLEINNRLRFMLEVGLGYLTLNRVSGTLSGGETQRLNLTRTLGSNLTASMYILDEPSIGLHPRDTQRLVKVLRRLRDLGNTVVVVEHEEDIIRSADFLVDMGPEAGIHGGEVVFAGAFDSIFKQAATSLTTRYLTGELKIEIPLKRRVPRYFIELKGARQNNLKNIDVRIPLQALTVVTGVSGSGKTTLVKQILHPALVQHFGESGSSSIGIYRSLEGDLKRITAVEMVNQNPIGKSSRSNPVTYVKAYDAIRNLMSSQSLARIRGYKPKHFSFNVEGGRCEACKGEGEQVIEMQFLADVRLECEECRGRRFKSDVLEVQYKGKSIHNILQMSIEEALTFFGDIPEITSKLKPLFDVGLGYVQLGQSSSTLSGGEAQRVKLAYFLTQERTTQRMLFIFDEPTTGLHFHDVARLIKALQALIERGHSILVVEHNLDVIKVADWVIDLGPEGGKDGGLLLYEGPPEGLTDVKESFTGLYLRTKLPTT